MQTMTQPTYRHSYKAPKIPRLWDEKISQPT